MEKAYLHIGVEKTGTTTIQSFMAKNRASLRHEGYLYPVAPGVENHVGLTIFAAEEPSLLSDLLIYVGLTAGADLNAYSKKMLAELEDGVRKSNCHTLVMSNEHLSSRIRNEKSIKKLRDALLGIADVVEIVVYLRRQDEIVLSEYSTRVKAGYAEPFSLEPHQLRNYNYADLLDRWSTVFGIEHTLVRVFEKQKFEGGDLLSDFLHVIQFPDSATTVKVPPQNTSLDVVCLEYLRRINRYLPPYIDGHYNKARGNIAAALNAISMGEKPRISTNEADEILNYFEESNRDVARRYLGRQDGQLFANTPERSVQNNLTIIDEEDAFKVSAALWSRRNSTR